MIAIFFLPALSTRESAGDGAWSGATVQGRKYVLNRRFGAVAKSLPLVSVSFVFAGEICRMPAWSRIGWTLWDTDEFRVETTPTTPGVDASFVAAWAPSCGFFWSSSACTASL